MSEPKPETSAAAGGGDMMARLLRALAMRVPPLRRLREDRDRLAARVHELLEDHDRLAARVRELLDDRHLFPAPRSPRPYGICEVVNPARYEDPEWLAIHHDLERYSLDKHCFQNRSGAVYRKGWEWTHCIYGLRKLGMIRPDRVALGVGAGRECVIYYLADHIRQVVASDLYGGSWTNAGGREADLALVEQSKSVCPPSVDFSKVAFENQDGTRLTYANESFDFCWSLSSIEHFGGYEAAAQAMREMARVTKPGGIVALATEMLLVDDYEHPEFFTRAGIDRWLVHATPELQLVEEIDYSTLPLVYLVDSIAVPHGVERHRRHVVLNDGGVQWTSVMLFLRKVG